MQTITIGSSVDDSIKLQKLIDNVGNTPAKFIFSDTTHVLVNSRIRFWNYFELDGKNSTFELQENVSTSIFGEQIPLIGSKLSKGAAGWDLHNVIFEGNRENQKCVPTKNREHPNAAGNWGNGYHNFIGPLCPGDISNVQTSNATDICIHDCEANNNLGDFARIEGGTNIKIWNIKGKRGGHDVVCLAGVHGGEVCNLKIDMAVNAAVRTRSSKNIKIHDCVLNGDTGIDTGPAIQIQSTAKNRTSSDIEVYNNEIFGTWGPAIWIIGTVPGNGLVTVRNNLFLECGKEPASVKTPDVGGITHDGFDCLIEYNTFDECYGYAIVASGWKSRSSLTGMKTTVRRNIITGTNESFCKGTKSGTGIANLTGTRNTIECIENCQYGNKTANHYGVTLQSVYNVDPLYRDSGNYKLKDDSPCVFPEYELGAYNGVAYHGPEDCWPSVVIPRKSETELKAFVQMLYGTKVLKEEEKVSYLNVSKEYGA